MSHSPTHSIDVNALGRYLAGESPEDERVRIEQYLHAHPEDAAVVRRLQAQPLHRGTIEDDDDIARGWARIRETMRDGRAVGPKSRTVPSRGWSRAVGFAAVAVMAVVLLWRSAPSPAPSSAPEVVRSYATNSREQAVVTLIDGTRVMLAPNTTLRLREFSGRIRAVDVDGEAYLDVVHASGAPFIVRSGRMNLRVLGTTFLVRHRPGDVRVGVAVVDGRVRMTMGADTVSGVTLSAGEVGEGMDSTIAVNTVSDIVPGAEWTHDQLLFHDTPLSTILAMVGRWYGYQFRYADSTLPSRKVTLGVSTQSSAEALAEIERVLKVNLAVVGDTITLVPGVRGTQQERHKMRTYDTWTPSREVGR